MVAIPWLCRVHRVKKEPIRVVRRLAAQSVHIHGGVEGLALGGRSVPKNEQQPLDTLHQQIAARVNVRSQKALLFETFFGQPIQEHLKLHILDLAPSIFRSKCFNRHL